MPIPFARFFHQLGVQSFGAIPQLYLARCYLSKNSTIEKFVNNFSKAACFDTFKKAVEVVPAYQKFIGNTKVSSFDKIPITNKKNYILPNMKRPSNLMVNGVLPICGRIDKTSGTTGSPVTWYRSADELEFSILQSKCIKVDNI